MITKHDTMEINNDGMPQTRNKRVRAEQATVADLMLVARILWEKADPHQRGTAQQEDSKFRQSFGCGPFVALAVWSMLERLQLVPPDGTIEHLLWTLQFMKVYGKTDNLCRLCGGCDAKTLRDWVWKFIEAIADLEPYVVRSYLLLIVSFPY